MRNLSNYPSGHPTGFSKGDESEVFMHDDAHNTCLYLLNAEDLVEVSYSFKGRFDKVKRVLKIKVCSYCGKPMVRALCEKCQQPATHIDTDRAVNASEAYCSSHYMGQR